MSFHRACCCRNVEIAVSIFQERYADAALARETGNMHESWERAWNASWSALLSDPNDDAWGIDFDLYFKAFPINYHIDEPTHAEDWVELATRRQGLELECYTGKDWIGFDPATQHLEQIKLHLKGEFAAWEGWPPTPLSTQLVTSRKLAAPHSVAPPGGGPRRLADRSGGSEVDSRAVSGEFEINLDLVQADLDLEEGGATYFLIFPNWTANPAFPATSPTSPWAPAAQEGGGGFYEATLTCRIVEGV